MFLRSQKRWKNGKQHRYFSVVENRRVAAARSAGSKVVQRTVLYLGEINDSQQAAWRKTLEVFDETDHQSRQLSLFPEDRPIPPDAVDAVQVKLSAMQLCRPRAFRCLKSDLAIRPVYHQLEHRVEAHIFVAFLGYCLMVTLKNLLRPHAPGLTARAVLEKLATIQMVDVRLPTTDGRWLIMPRHTQPEPEHKMILDLLGLTLPPQPPPRITAGRLPDAQPSEQAADM